MIAFATVALTLLIPVARSSATEDSGTVIFIPIWESQSVTLPLVLQSLSTLSYDGTYWFHSELPIEGTVNEALINAFTSSDKRVRKSSSPDDSDFRSHCVAVISKASESFENMLVIDISKAIHLNSGAIGSLHDSLQSLQSQERSRSLVSPSLLDVLGYTNSVIPFEEELAGSPYLQRVFWAEGTWYFSLEGSREKAEKLFIDPGLPDVNMWVVVGSPLGFFTSQAESADDIVIAQLQLLSRNVFTSKVYDLRLEFPPVFYINLDRRRERKTYMDSSFNVLGIDYARFSAYDARHMDELVLKSAGVSMMEGYLDPILLRPMKLGEIGCLLSHYNLWKQVVQDEIPLAVILEDDVHFLPNFVRGLHPAIEEAQLLAFHLLYIGRKPLESNRPCPECRLLVKPGYSYWTVGYVISLEGARLLLSSGVLSSAIPVDEFLPVMYGSHPIREWSAAFEGSGSLRAYSTAVPIVAPLHFEGDSSYVSDTEQSSIIQQQCQAEGTCQ